ncbi:MAG TPA: SulP family inorganic anion transporter [Casimicrobiaceae bacterium]|nr:SulP family inorganic anion transporter [Casimicrobiaceae bacterium]
MPDPGPAPQHALLDKWLPGLGQLLPYPKGALRGDATAALSVCVVLIPSVLAYAELVGLRPEAGLYAALASMVVYALFTSTRRVIIGPDTTIALLAGSVIVPLAAGDPTRAAALAAALALMTGVLLVVAGRVGFGDVADLLSTPVLVGYAAGAALILIGTQLPSLLGVALPRDAFFLRVFDAIAALPKANPYTAVLGLGLVALMIALAQFTPRVPAALVACAIAIATSQALDLGARAVVHLAPLKASIPAPSLPTIAVLDLQALAPGAIALAFLVFAEGILIARALAAKYREAVDPDHELVALGAGNLASGLVSGFPVGATTSRSVTADASGAQTQLTQWIAAALLVVFVLFVTPWLVVLPRVALSAILIAAGIRLVDIGEWKSLFRLDRRSFLLAGGVALGVLVLGVLPGVLLGIGLSLARILLEVARPRDAILRRLPTDRRFHDLADDEGGASTPAVLVYRLYAPILFANARYVADRLRTLAASAKPPLRCIVLDMQAVSHIDVTALAVLRDLHEELETGGIDVRFARANRPLREQLLRWIGDEGLGKERFFPSASAAVDDFLATRPRKGK